MLPIMVCHDTKCKCLGNEVNLEGTFLKEKTTRESETERLDFALHWFLKRFDPDLISILIHRNCFGSGVAYIVFSFWFLFDVLCNVFLEMFWPSHDS